MSDRDLVAEFIAKGGKVQTLPTDARTVSERQIFNAYRQGVRLACEPLEPCELESERTLQFGRETVMMRRLIG